MGTPIPSSQMPDVMGFVFARVHAFSSDGSKHVEQTLLVDTGSTLTWLPADLLHDLGIEAIREEEFVTVNRDVLRRPVGSVTLEVEGIRSPVPVAFGHPGDVSLLGLTALETLGFEVDPVTHTLRKTSLLALTT